jgi:hypothetical protein
MHSIINSITHIMSINTYYDLQYSQTTDEKLYSAYRAKSGSCLTLFSVERKPLISLQIRTNDGSGAGVMYTRAITGISTSTSTSSGISASTPAGTTETKVKTSDKQFHYLQSLDNKRIEFIITNLMDGQIVLYITNNDTGKTINEVNCIGGMQSEVIKSDASCGNLALILRSFEAKTGTKLTVREDELKLTAAGKPKDKTDGLYFTVTAIPSDTSTARSDFKGAVWQTVDQFVLVGPAPSMTPSTARTGGDVWEMYQNMPDFEMQGECLSESRESAGPVEFQGRGRTESRAGAMRYSAPRFMDTSFSDDSLGSGAGARSHGSGFSDTRGPPPGSAMFSPASVVPSAASVPASFTPMGEVTWLTDTSAIRGRESAASAASAAPPMSSDAARRLIEESSVGTLAHGEHIAVHSRIDPDAEIAYDCPLSCVLGLSIAPGLTMVTLSSTEASTLAKELVTGIVEQKYDAFLTDTGHHYKDTSCCICMDDDKGGPDQIFYQCGHVCTHDECAKTITACPFCRATINAKLKIVTKVTAESTTATPVSLV